MNKRQKENYEAVIRFLKKQYETCRDLVEIFKEKPHTRQLFIDDEKKVQDFILFLNRTPEERKQDKECYYEIMNYINSYVVTAMSATPEERKTAGFTERNIKDYLLYIKTMRKEAEG